MIQTSRRPWRTAIAVAGLGGFGGLLVSSHYFPSAADPLRVLALVWFFGFGFARFAVDLKARVDTDARSADRP